MFFELVCAQRHLSLTLTQASQWLVALCTMGAIGVVRSDHMVLHAAARSRAPSAAAGGGRPCHGEVSAGRSFDVLRLVGGTADADSAAGAFVLCTDLDDTLVGDAEALAEFNRLWRRELAPR